MTPMDMLARAVQSGADLDMIEKLMNLQETLGGRQRSQGFRGIAGEGQGRNPGHHPQCERSQQQEVRRLRCDRKGD
jgi:hypothetical protein